MEIVAEILVALLVVNVGATFTILFRLGEYQARLKNVEREVFKRGEKKAC